MIYPQVDPKEWADRYGINIMATLCKKCEKPQQFTKPFAWHQFRGLISDHGECGEEYRQSVFVPVDKDERRMLGQFVERFCASQATNTGGNVADKEGT